MALRAEKSVLVPIANGSEEIEAITIIDVLRRAGANVTVASVEDDLQVEMSRKVKVVADKKIEEMVGQTFDLIALPGGIPGAERLGKCETLIELLRAQQDAGRFVTAICAAPAVVLEAQGFLKGKKATAHPAFTDKLSDQSAIKERVVVDGNTITSRGPGTSLEFSLRLVAALFSAEKADEVAAPMVIEKGEY